MKIINTENILIISLLRIGDVFMLSSSLKEVRKQYPNANITILINDSFKFMSSLIPFVDDVIFFPRKQLQAALVDKNESIFTAFEWIDQFVSSRKEKFTEVINLTHTTLSAYLIESLDVDSVRGMFSFAEKIGVLGHGFKAINSKSTFHYVDEFKFAVSDFSSDDRQLYIKKQSIEEYNSDSNVIALQIFTSDEKKNWKLSYWQKLIDALCVEYPECQILALAAPGESEKLSELKNVTIVGCTLQQAAGILKRSKFLVSVDTSIKHLAIAVGTPVVELALGSSNYQYTGSYSENSIIVSPKIDCIPCEHQSTCYKKSYECSDKLMPGSVLEAVRVLDGRSSVDLFVKKYGIVTDIIQPQFSEFGFILFISSNCRESNIRDYLEKVSSLFVQKKELNKALPGYASYSLVMLKELRQFFGDVNLNYHLETIECRDKQVQIVAKNLINKILRFNTEKNNGQFRIL